MSTFAGSPVLVLVGGVLLLAAILLGRRIDVRLGSVHAQLMPNSGSSLRDAVDRIEATLTEHGDRLDNLESASQPPPPIALAVVNAPTPETPSP